MASVLVVNASPLILLSRIKRLDLLTSLADSLVVPETVMQEVRAGSDRDDAAEQVQKLDTVNRVEDVPVPERVRVRSLGSGESQVLAHGLQRPEAELVLDDYAARKCARDLGLPLIGTLGVVILCRHRGIIPAARPIVEALRAAGLRLKLSLMDAALAKVGE